MYQQQQQPSIPVSGEITGWFGRARTRLFGQRDPVEAQLRDIARQGAFGAAVSHFVATLLLILFSFASLIALGADSLQAVLASLNHGTVDIPNAVATGVTALLVPAMDWSMLRAAAKIRLLMTRRADGKDLVLHIIVVAGVAVLETSTYCYMAGRYEHPGVWVAWVLIVARATGAPLLGVYLATDRAHPPTARDMMAQVELRSGEELIRDITRTASDQDAPTVRKAEIFGASAIMRDDDRQRLGNLVDVLQRHDGTALPMPRARIVAASATLPEMEPQAHYSAQAMHDWDEDYDIADEVEDEMEEDNDLFSTTKIPAVRLNSRPLPSADTTETVRRSRTPKNSGPNNSNLERSKSMREFNRKLKSDAKARRRADIRDATYAILDEWHAAGRTEQISDKELARRVATRVNFDVNPSGNTVARWRGPWQSSRAHKAAILATDMDDVSPMEPQELRELQEVW